MKAISIRQPWAWLITRPDLTDRAARLRELAAGRIKTIENRTWATKFRGPVALHASASMTRTEYADVLDFLMRDPALKPIYHAMPHFDEMRKQCGGIVGTALLQDCIDDSQSPWYMGQFGFVLADIRPLPLIPCKGALQFFNVPDEVLHQIELLELQS